MLVVHVQVHVKPEYIRRFEEVTAVNASRSLEEPGVARFDVVREEADPSHFVLVEAYRTDDAPAAHKGTAHYQQWRDAVEPMMATPRTSVKYRTVFPIAEDW